ncbi:MAG: hypothetical protein LBB19_04575 [Puniceicoccales bacterium]|jgi:hypothetical protein|nr:hypothetical protein [Puniceicoccales bacterium]
MKCDVQKIIKAGGIMAIIIGAAISLHAWWCTDCQEEHDDPFCPTTRKDKDGFAPSDYPYLGVIADNASVHDTPYGLKTQEGRAIRQVREGYFLYELPTSFGTLIYYDGRNAYNEAGEKYPTAPGHTADGNLVFEGPPLFTVYLNKYTPIIQTKDGRYVHEKPRHRYQNVAYSKDVYFNGVEHVDYEGNTYKERDLKIPNDD